MGNGGVQPRTANSNAGSTSSLGRASTCSMNVENEGNMRSVLPMRSPQTIGSTTNGSEQRKRSRVYEEAQMFMQEGLSKRESYAQKTKIDGLLQQLYAQVEQVLAKGERGKTMVNKQAVFDTLRLIGMDIMSLLASVTNLHDEKSALQYQVIQLQSQQTFGGGTTAMSGGSTATNTYLQAAMARSTATSIAIGRSPLIPEIPISLKHAPSERILIFKADVKGVQQTKEQQETFRRDINESIGENLMQEVDVIRPTRHGGHTVIFQSEQARDKTLEALREIEKGAGVAEERSCIVAPKRKFARVVCRDPPDDVSIESMIEAMYGRNNPHLCQIPKGSRIAKIIDTRFGWIFEMTSLEVAAVQAQGGRIRVGNARELKVEEYIPLQQCYKCCAFGHNAKNFLSEVAYCRLCGAIGHAGWDYPEKDNREHWKYTNCIISNETKGLHHPIDHTAAQLHKCPCAQSHRETRKAQLAAAGIYTTPLAIGINNMKSSSSSMQTQTKGPQQQRPGNARSGSIGNDSRKHRSRSNKRTMFNQAAAVSSRASYSSFSSSSSSSSSSNKQTDGKPILGNSIYALRQIRVPRPSSFDGWKVVGRGQGSRENNERRGRDTDIREQSTNSQSNLQMVRVDSQISMNIMPTNYNE